MPILASSAYVNAETVLNRLRMILNDSEVIGGDVITDTAPFTFVLLNAAYEKVQMKLAESGLETYTAEAWLVGLPIMPTVDPEARMIVDDTGCNIIYPSGVGNVFSLTPQLPTDLVLPLVLSERQTGTANFVGKMRQPNDGLLNMAQQTALVDWQWESDGLRFRGALQSQDVKIKYEKLLPQLAAPTDPVPIRGVTNMAAREAALIFCQSRGGAVSPMFKVEADEEVQMMKMVSARRRQRKQVRRRPYSGRSSTQTF